MFVVSPYLQAFYISLTDWQGFSEQKNFIGLDNFISLSQDPVFWMSVTNTIMYTVVATVGKFLLGLVKHFAVTELLVELQVKDELDILDIHGQALEPVGDLGADRIAFDAAHLLEIGELGDLHPVAPHFPAQAPGAERRAFPVVLDKADVVQL